MRTAVLPLTLALCLPLSAMADSPAATVTERVAPAPHCLDARQTTGMYQSDDSTVVVATGQQHYRIELAASCPGLDRDSQLSLRAPGGWVCGGPNETVAAAGSRCPVASVTPIDSRDYALAARQAVRNQHGSHSADGTTLDTVEVTAQAGINRDDRYARGFVGTADYCFDPAQMRSWNETPDGLVVQVSPRRNAGNSTYAVELSGSCPMLSSSPSVFFRSGMGLGVICGNAGDRVVAVRDTFVNESSPALAYAGSFLLPPQDIGGNIATAITGQCSIQAVYPVHS